MEESRGSRTHAEDLDNSVDLVTIFLQTLEKKIRPFCMEISSWISTRTVTVGAVGHGVSAVFSGHLGGGARCLKPFTATSEDYRASRRASQCCPCLADNTGYQ